VRVIEMAPILLILGLSAVLTINAGQAMRYLDATAQSLHAPRGYIADVLGPK
jgi:multicomponent K+:H+ antiporter subunit D